MSNLAETSVNQLYQSTVSGFPRTTRRQHSTQPIRIVNMEWTPYLGMKTLYIKATAQNPESKTHSQSEYPVRIVFKNVIYAEGDNTVHIIASDNNQYTLQKLSPEQDILVRCDCGDFVWRGTHADYLDHCLFGRNRKKYEGLGVRPPVNPDNTPMMCKHILRVLEALRDSGILLT